MEKEKELDEFLVEDVQQRAEAINDLYMRIRLLKRDRQQLQREFAQLHHLVNGLMALVVGLTILFVGAMVIWLVL